MPRLLKIMWREPPGFPGLRHQATFEIGKRDGLYAGFKVSLTPAKVILESPQGWKPGEYARDFNGSHRRVFITSRDRVDEEWDFAHGEVAVAPREWSQAEWEKEHEAAEVAISRAATLDMESSGAPPAPVELPDNDPDAIVPTKAKRR